jgi:hypothetical protein
MHEYMHNRGVPPAAWQGPLLKGFRIPPTYTGVGNLQKECCTSDLPSHAAQYAIVVKRMGILRGLEYKRRPTIKKKVL